MADESAPSGKGGGRGTTRKFAPTVPSRRKKADDSSAAAPSAAEAAAANEAFQDLIRAAQSESKWERGRGFGRGRGRGGWTPQQVTFGGGDEGSVRPVGRAPAPTRIGYAGGVKQQPGGSSSAATKKEAKLRLKSEPGAATPEGKPCYDAGGDDMDTDSDELGPLFDYSQYYPTTLPLSLHHPEDDAADAVYEQQLIRRGVPQDLVLQQDFPEHTAQHLGLSDLSAAQDLLYLFQLPAVLPIVVPPKAEPADARGQRRSKASTAAAAAAAGPTAANIKDLPSGNIGKLLIFRSGKVKMRIGDVLLDVTAGLPCVTRQDVAAVNTSSKHLVQLGPVAQRAVVCPDVWQLMDDAPVPDFPRSHAAYKQQQRQEGATAAAAAAAAENGLKSSSEEEEDDDDEQMSEGNTAAAAATAAEDSATGTKVSATAAMPAAAAAAAAADSMDVDEHKQQEESETSSEDEAAKQQQQQQLEQQRQAEAAAAAAKAAAAAPADGALGLLGLTAGAVAAGARGKGRFMPAARPRANVKKEGQ